MEDSEANKESEASDKVEAREGKSIDVEDKTGPGATAEEEPEAAAQLAREGKSLEEDEVAVTDEDSQTSEQENATDE